MRRLLSVILFTMAFSISIISQTSVNSSGGDVKTASGSVSYSIGQVFTSSTNDTSGTVSEGIQQAFEVSVISSIDDAIELNCTAYPNPTINTLHLKVDNFSAELELSLYDIKGKQLLKKAVISETTVIDFSDYHPGFYILKVNNEQQELKSFKIAKH